MTGNDERVHESLDAEGSRNWECSHRVAGRNAERTRNKLKQGIELESLQMPWMAFEDMSTVMHPPYLSTMSFGNKSPIQPTCTRFSDQWCIVLTCKV